MKSAIGVKIWGEFLVQHAHESVNGRRKLLHTESEMCAEQLEEKYAYLDGTTYKDNVGRDVRQQTW